MTAIKVMRGVVGWSNKRAGVELYAEMVDDVWPRWRRDNARQIEVGGALLADAIDQPMGVTEGADLIVMVVPRHELPGTALFLEHRIREVVRQLERPSRLARLRMRLGL